MSRSSHPHHATSLAATMSWERPVVPRTGGEATLLIRIAAPAAEPSGTRRSPVDVAFVLDRSGSMAGDKLALVKDAVEVAVGHLRDDDRAALVVYDQTVDVLHPLAAATPRAKTALRLALHGVDPGGSTDLGAGWLTACGELARAAEADEGSARIRRALLLTDGLANVGITDPAELTEHALQLRRRGVGTTTLGVGLDFDEALLESMAESGGGNFQFIAESRQLRAFFERELRELLTIAAAGLTVTLTVPHGVRARLVSPLPCQRHGKRFEISLGDLPAGDTLDLVFTLRIAPGALGTSHRLGLDLRWSDPAADEARALAITSDPLTLAEAATVESTPIDPTFAERAALQRATAERREALRLDRAGQFAASRARMQMAAQALQAAPMTADVREDLTMTMRYAMADDDRAYSSHERKAGTYHNARRARGKAIEPSETMPRLDED